MRPLSITATRSVTSRANPMTGMTTIIVRPWCAGLQYVGTSPTSWGGQRGRRIVDEHELRSQVSAPANRDTLLLTPGQNK